MRTITNVKNPSLAVNDEPTGRPALPAVHRHPLGDAARTGSNAWATTAATVVPLHTAPSTTPARTFLPYLGDYARLLAVGTNFFGVFCGNNTPDPANFPSGIAYQRNANWTTHTLLSTDNTTPVAPSIDPFFFQWTPPHIIISPHPIVGVEPITREPIIRQPQPVARTPVGIDPGPVHTTTAAATRPAGRARPRKSPPGGGSEIKLDLEPDERRRDDRDDERARRERDADQHASRLLERPSLGLGLLQAHCQRADVPCETRYLNIAFAELVGIEEYLWLSGEVPYTAFAGEWLFSEALYGDRPEADAGYLDEILRRDWRFGDPDVARLLRMRPLVRPFLESCLEQIPWDEYTLVGFTSTFQQNLASLALARLVKQARPSTTIAFGGANWEEAMGAALQREFPFVDLAFSGEADLTFPAVLEARREGRTLAGIKGVVVAGSDSTAAGAPAASVAALDDLPIPDFDPFFEQHAASRAGGVAPTMLVETARGCWWGERSHCTFCGLNGTTMTFRSKSPERAFHELAFLRQRYGAAVFSVVDDILDLRYFDSVIPMLAAAKLGIEFFWEIKET